MANFQKLKKYHYIYKTTNLLNEKYYIGVHSTNNLEDGYLGSGKYLWRSLKKYGKENFKIEILEFYNNREELMEREKELVTLDKIKDSLCMNLKPGGRGGLCNDEHAYKFHAAGGRAVRKLLSKRHHERFKNDPIYRARCIEQMLGKQKWLGKQHTEETKKLQSLVKQGTGTKENNSQFGTCWITKEGINKKIKKEELEAYLSQEWSKGRKY